MLLAKNSPRPRVSPLAASRIAAQLSPRNAHLTSQRWGTAPSSPQTAASRLKEPPASPRPSLTSPKQLPAAQRTPPDTHVPVRNFAPHDDAAPPPVCITKVSVVGGRTPVVAAVPWATSCAHPLDTPHSCTNAPYLRLDAPHSRTDASHPSLDVLHLPPDVFHPQTDALHLPLLAVVPLGGGTLESPTCGADGGASHHTLEALLACSEVNPEPDGAPVLLHQALTSSPQPIIASGLAKVQCASQAGVADRTQLPLCELCAPAELRPALPPPQEQHCPRLLRPPAAATAIAVPALARRQHGVSAAASARGASSWWWDDPAPAAGSLPAIDESMLARSVSGGDTGSDAWPALQAPWLPSNTLMAVGGGWSAAGKCGTDACRCHTLDLPCGLVDALLADRGPRRGGTCTDRRPLEGLEEAAARQQRSRACTAPPVSGGRLAAVAERYAHSRGDTDAGAWRSKAPKAARAQRQWSDAGMEAHKQKHSPPCSAGALLRHETCASSPPHALLDNTGELSGLGAGFACPTADVVAAPLDLRSTQPRRWRAEAQLLRPLDAPRGAPHSTASSGSCPGSGGAGGGGGGGGGRRLSGQLCGGAPAPCGVGVDHGGTVDDEQAAWHPMFGGSTETGSPPPPPRSLRSRSLGQIAAGTLAWLGLSARGGAAASATACTPASHDLPLTESFSEDGSCSRESSMSAVCPHRSSEAGDSQQSHLGLRPPPYPGDGQRAAVPPALRQQSGVVVSGQFSIAGPSGARGSACPAAAVAAPRAAQQPVPGPTLQRAEGAETSAGGAPARSSAGTPPRRPRASLKRSREPEPADLQTTPVKGNTPPALRLSPESASVQKSRRLKPPGFANLGNMCWMNGGLQVVFGVSSLLRDLASPALRSLPLPPDGICVALMEYSRLHEAGSRSGLRCVTPLALCEALGRLCPELRGLSGRCPKVFVQKLMELTQVEVETARDQLSPSSRVSRAAVCPATRATGGGEFTDTLCCSICDATIQVLEWFRQLTVVVPADSSGSGPQPAVTVLQLLSDSLQMLDRVCPCAFCGVATTHTVSRCISGLPRALVVFVERYFLQPGGHWLMCEAPVAVPDVLKLEPLCLPTALAPPLLAAAAAATAAAQHSGSVPQLPTCVTPGPAAPTAYATPPRRPTPAAATLAASPMAARMPGAVVRELYASSGRLSTPPHTPRTPTSAPQSGADAAAVHLSLALAPAAGSAAAGGSHAASGAAAAPLASLLLHEVAQFHLVGVMRSLGTPAPQRCAHVVTAARYCTSGLWYSHDDAVVTRTTLAEAQALALTNSFMLVFEIDGAAVQ